MNRFADDTLLDSLAAALAVAPATPTAAEVAAVRALVLDRDGSVVVAVPHWRATRHPARRGLVAALVAIALVLGGGVAALATGTPLPRVLRSPARALGLPVDSAALADARSAAAELRAALDGGDAVRIARARAVLIARVTALGVDDRNAIAREANELLERADARLAGAAEDSAASLGASSTMPANQLELDDPARTAPSGSDATPPADTGDGAKPDEIGTPELKIGGESPTPAPGVQPELAQPTESTEPMEPTEQAQAPEPADGAPSFGAEGGLDN